MTSSLTDHPIINRLTNENDVALRVELWDFDNGYVYADYESFR